LESYFVGKRRKMIAKDRKVELRINFDPIHAVTRKDERKKIRFQSVENFEKKDLPFRKSKATGQRA